MFPQEWKSVYVAKDFKLLLLILGNVLPAQVGVPITWLPVQ